MNCDVHDRGITHAVLVIVAALFVLCSVVGSGWAGARLGSTAFIGLPLWAHQLGVIMSSVVGAAAAFIKVLLPIDCRGISRSTTLRVIFMWLTCLAYCWLTVMLATLEFLALTKPSLLFAASAWLFIEISAGLASAIASNAFSPSQKAPAASRSKPVPGFRGSLLSLIEHVVAGGSTHGQEEMRLEPDGWIFTSQGTLARLIGCNKGAINRQLWSLQAQGRIRLTTTPGGTRIALALSEPPQPK